jgi:NifU-like protein
MAILMSYSPQLLDHALSPRHCGFLINPDFIGIAGIDGCAPYMVLHLRTELSVIRDCRFRTFGCGPSIACGSVLCELIIGKSFDECAGITDRDIADRLGGLPREKEWCCRFALDSLRNALEDQVAAHLFSSGTNSGAVPTKNGSSSREPSNDRYIKERSHHD